MHQQPPRTRGPGSLRRDLVAARLYLKFSECEGLLAPIRHNLNLRRCGQNPALRTGALHCRREGVFAEADLFIQQLDRISGNLRLRPRARNLFIDILPARIGIQPLRHFRGGALPFDFCDDFAGSVTDGEFRPPFRLVTLRQFAFHDRLTGRQRIAVTVEHAVELQLLPNRRETVNFQYSGQFSKLSVDLRHAENHPIQRPVADKGAARFPDGLFFRNRRSGFLRSRPARRQEGDFSERHRIVAAECGQVPAVHHRSAVAEEIREHFPVRRRLKPAAGKWDRHLHHPAAIGKRRNGGAEKRLFLRRLVELPLLRIHCIHTVCVIEIRGGEFVIHRPFITADIHFAAHRDFRIGNAQHHLHRVVIVEKGVVPRPRIRLRPPAGRLGTDRRNIEVIPVVLQPEFRRNSVAFPAAERHDLLQNAACLPFVFIEGPVDFRRLLRERHRRLRNLRCAENATQQQTAEQSVKFSVFFHTFPHLSADYHFR